MRTLIFLMTALLSPILISAQDEIGLKTQHVEPVFEFQDEQTIEISITIELIIDFPCITCTPRMTPIEQPTLNALRAAHLDKKAAFVAKHHSRYARHENQYVVDQWTFPNRFTFNAPWAWSGKK
ncbi:MAG: hypothetical protein AAF598_21130 [Bacteroidota bacterium]